MELPEASTSDPPPAPPQDSAPAPAPRMKIRIKRPVTMPNDFMTPDAALQSLRAEEKIQAKRQRTREASERAGRGQRSPLLSAMQMMLPRETGRRGTPHPPEPAPLVVDLDSLLTIKDQRPRQWGRQWVEVSSLFGSGKLRLMRWVPEGPPLLPRLQPRPMAAPSKLQRNMSGDSLAGLPQSAKTIAASLAAEYTPGGGGGGAAGAPVVLGPDGERVQMVPCTHPNCKKMFPSVTSMRKHAHMHSEKTFACTHSGCNKAFVDASKLKRHMMSHATEKPFRCPMPACGKEFSLEFNLKSHLKSVHPGVAAPMLAEAGSRDGSRNSSPQLRATPPPLPSQEYQG